MKVVLCLAAALLAVRPSVARADVPCTGCVVWEVPGAEAEVLLAFDASLRGLALLVAPAGAPIAPERLEALRARGADVGLVHEIDGEPPEPSADVLRRVSRLLIRSASAPDPKAAAFTIRRLATRARALRPGIEVGVEAAPDIVAAVTPYVDFAVARAGEPLPQGLPVWEKGRTLRVLDAASLGAALAAANPDALPAGPDAPATVPRFSSDVEVVARRTLSVEEVIARHQAAAVRQGERITSWVGSGSTIIAFQAPGLAAPMTITADTVVFVGPGVHEVEQREVRLNGVAVPIGRDAVPRLPIIEPERVSAAPLALVRDERYRYRLEKPEAVDGHPSYVVVFEPATSGTALMSGRAWISAEDFGLVRMDAEQTGLRGPIVSSRQRDEYRALDVDGERAWVLRRSETQQSYEGPGHRTPIHRVMTLEDTYEPNPPDFAARRHAAHRSSSVLLALTDEGFRYLRRDAPPPAAVTPGEAQTEQPSALRTIAGRSTRIWTAAAGLLVDPNIDDPLPFAGLGYLDLDFLGTGSQVNAFAAGPFLSLAWSAPSLGGGRTLVQVRGFASLVEYNDRSFRDGIERYDENVRQRPASAAIDLIRPFGAGWRVRASYELARPGLRRGPDTAPAFQTPASPTVHAARLGLEGEVARWTLSAWASVARRDRWSDWGFAGNPDSSPEARNYERAGAGAARSFVLGPRVAARVDVAALAGRGLDRFSRFTFDGLENRLHGSPSATVRFDRGVVLRSALSATASRAVRGDLFLDLAVVRDPAQGTGHRAFPGLGAAAELRLPWSTLLSAEWGYGPEARDREGQRGAHVLRITAYKIL